MIRAVDLEPGKGMQLDFDLALPVIHVAGIASDGWFSKDMTLGEFGRAREQLAHVDPLLIQIEGPLA